MKSFKVAICVTDDEKGFPAVFILSFDVKGTTPCDCPRDTELGYDREDGFKSITLNFEVDKFATIWFDHVATFSEFSEEDSSFNCTATCVHDWIKKVTNVRFAEGVPEFSLCSDTNVMHFYFATQESGQRFVFKNIKKLSPVEVVQKAIEV